jgi:hypothetical protein
MLNFFWWRGSRLLLLIIALDAIMLVLGSCSSSAAVVASDSGMATSVARLPVVVKEQEPTVPAPPTATPVRTPRPTPRSDTTDFYAAPDGSSEGDGTIAYPWDLQTALNQPDSVRPGVTIWLRGGKYLGSFTSRLRGSEGAPIIVRQYPGERATIDADSTDTGAILEVEGEWATFWGFEVTNSAQKRISHQDGSAPADLKRGNGLNVHGPHMKFINMVIHDAADGVGFWSEAPDSEIAGSIIYNNGWQGPDRGHGHGIYVQNRDGTKRMVDNIIFNQFSFGIHAYGSDEAFLRGLYLEGNVSFNNGSVSHDEENPNILVGGGSPAERVTITENYTFRTHPLDVNVRLDYGETHNLDLICTNNYFVGGNGVLRLQDWERVTMTGNTFYGAGNLINFLLPNGADISSYQWNNNTYYQATDWLSFVLRGQSMALPEWQRLTGFDRDSQLSVGRPSENKIVVRPNPYEPGRAHIIVYNWTHQPTVDVDVSHILTPGAQYQVHNVPDYFGAPVQTGVYDGHPLSLPMAAIAATPPIGEQVVPPHRTGPDFQVFVLSSTS